MKKNNITTLKTFNLNSINRTYFGVKEGNFCGQKAFLVGPKDKEIVHDIKWDHENKYFRSCVLSEEGVLLSAGFPKFMNHGEAEDTFPAPKSLHSGMTIVEKIDGSCMIVDCHNGIMNARTRGTLDARVLPNGDEFYEVLAKNPKIRFFLDNHRDISLLFEIVTPKQQIVVKYDSLDIYLIGAVNKNNYRLFPQEVVDDIAVEMGVQRPKRLSFNSLEKLLSEVKGWSGKEGVCLYSSADTIHKIKSDWWLRANAIFKNFGAKKRLIDYYIQNGEPTVDKIIELLSKEHDFELVSLVRGRFERLFEIREEIRGRIYRTRQTLKKYKDLSRKDLAAKLFSDKKIKEPSFYFWVLDDAIPERWLRRQYMEKFNQKDVAAD